MILQINNHYKKIVYFNRKTNTLIENLWNLLTFNRLRSSSLTAHEQNISKFVLRPDQYKEVLPGIVPIPPRSRWLYDGKSFFSNNNPAIYKSSKADLSDLLLIIRRLLVKIKKEGIAVELSGGLDTSIIIGILEHLGVKPLLIGVKSDRYEFRTEAIVQEIYCRRVPKVHLINNEESLPFTDLLNAPSHQLPSSTSLFHTHAGQIAKICKENGINIILNGMGFDTLFCDSPYLHGNQRLSDSWFSWMLDDNWFNENVYGKFGLNYKSAAASNTIIQTIYSMRQDQGEDPKKWWARHTFADFLPSELVKFAYKADNIGNLIDGIWKATDEIRTIFRIVYDLTRFDEFNQRSLDILISNVQENKENQIKQILARVSFANWIYGLTRENLILNQDFSGKEASMDTSLR